MVRRKRISETAPSKANMLTSVPCFEHLVDLNEITGDVQAASGSDVTGRYPTINQTAIDTTDEAAVAAWEAIQTLIATIPQIDNTVESKTFNLATESYG